MYFNTKYVVEEYEYDDAYTIVYNDPDANIVNQEILVDEETYWTCIEATEKGEELSGILIVNWFDSCLCVKIYGFISDEDIID